MINIDNVDFDNVTLSFGNESPMVLTFDTSIDTGVFMLVAEDANLTIDWGDGVVEQYTNPSDYITHTFPTSAVYTTQIYGTTNTLDISWNYNLTGVIDWGTLGIVIGDWMFDNCRNLEYVPNYLPSTMTSIRFLLSGTRQFNHPNVLDWDLSHVTDIGGLFYNTWIFNQPIGSWDVSNITIMDNLFAGALAFNQPIGSWNVSNVTDMSYMFNNNKVFNQDLSSWNTGAVTNMRNMFASTTFNQPIGNWNTSNVTNMYAMFAGTTFGGTFITPFNQPIGNWDVSKVTNMSAMFQYSAFNQDISLWNVGLVTDMSSMFNDSTFNQSINSWNVSSVTNMQGMFSGAQFNQPIGDWNTISVSNMGYMFWNATAFNQNLSTWCVSLIPSKPAGFDDGATSWSLSRPIWGTCPP